MEGIYETIEGRPALRFERRLPRPVVPPHHVRDPDSGRLLCPLLALRDPEDEEEGGREDDEDENEHADERVDQELLSAFRFGVPVHLLSPSTA